MVLKLFAAFKKMVGSTARIIGYLCNGAIIAFDHCIVVSAEFALSC